MEIIRSEAFSRYRQIVFGMSTRLGGCSPGRLGMNLSFNVGDDKVNVIENRRRFFGALHIGLDELAFPMQCHSNAVRAVTTWGGYEECDGLATNEYGVFIVLSIADCVPIFLFDPLTRTIAGIHAGWRGTSTGIVAKGVVLLKTELGVEPKNVVAYIGPAAGKCCYQVGDEVAEKFDDRFRHKDSQGKWKVDLKSANQQQLVSEGILPENIEVHGGCTIHEDKIFHSYRRDGKASGRMMGVIGIVR
jgi:YfiH family protein